jgi:folate-binding protein YgfZ
MWKIIKVTGKDAAEFLNRVTSGPVRPLAVGTGAAGALFTGQSKVIAQFDLLHTAELEFCLSSPTPCATRLAESLEVLHFAEDLTIELLPEEYFSVKREGTKRDERFAIPDFPRSWPTGVKDFVCEKSTAAGDWDFARIGASYPWPEKDWNEATPALEAGLLFAIDRNKGCYPGQEVVELSLNVGHPVRVLQAFEGKVSLSSGRAVALLPKGEGVVCSAASSGGLTRIFLRMPWAFRDSCPEGFRKLD